MRGKFDIAGSGSDQAGAINIRFDIAGNFVLRPQTGSADRRTTSRPCRKGKRSGCHQCSDRAVRIRTQNDVPCCRHI